jgi:hypothetical protein
MVPQAPSGDGSEAGWGTGWLPLGQWLAYFCVSGWQAGVQLWQGGGIAFTLLIEAGRLSAGIGDKASQASTCSRPCPFLPGTLSQSPVSLGFTRDPVAGTCSPWPLLPFHTSAPLVRGLVISLTQGELQVVMHLHCIPTSYIGHGRHAYSGTCFATLLQCRALRVERSCRCIFPFMVSGGSSVDAQARFVSKMQRSCTVV